MWQVVTSKRVEKRLRKLPPQALRKYQVWLEIVETGGPQNLRQIPGFNDEALHGQLSGSRSSRLDKNTRLIYTVEQKIVTVTIEDITAQHDYRKK
jgi:mRNA-degrading endonuclease RelE of RelBE toxin-antitoxin system